MRWRRKRQANESLFFNEHCQCFKYDYDDDPIIIITTSQAKEQSTHTHTHTSRSLASSWKNWKLFHSCSWILSLLLPLFHVSFGCPRCHTPSLSWLNEHHCHHHHRLGLVSLIVTPLGRTIMGPTYLRIATSLVGTGHPHASFPFDWTILTYTHTHRQRKKNDDDDNGDDVAYIYSSSSSDDGEEVTLMYSKHEVSWIIIIFIDFSFSYRVSYPRWLEPSSIYYTSSWHQE